MRTLERAVALAWARGCEGENDCWPECQEAALDTIVEGELEEWEKKWASTSAYWKFTHLSGNPNYWPELLARRQGEAG